MLNVLGLVKRMCSAFDVKIKPLTPIWTGDVKRKNTELRETGIIGSLRWWYEALIRGLGGRACDPTSDSKCNLDQKKFKKAIREGKSIQNTLSELICPACQLFGCTGWSRKFILHVDSLNKSFAPFIIARPSGSKKPYFLGYYDSSGKAYGRNGGLLGEYKLMFYSKEDKLELIKLLLKIAAKWGWGAGVQKGFGMVYIEDEVNFSNAELPINRNFSQKEDYRLPLPRIDQFFFYRIPFKNEFILQIRKIVSSSVYKTMSDLKNNSPLNETFDSYTYIPTSPWVRCSIRTSFKNNSVLRHFLMGFVSDNNLNPIHLGCCSHSIVDDRNNKGKYYCTTCRNGGIDEHDILEKTGSKIFVSHIYNKNAFKTGKKPKWEMKIWGWIPDLPEKLGTKRDDVKNMLQSNIKSEAFWKNTFGLTDNPVIIESIWEMWDINPHILLDSGSDFYE
ncbi:MAG TPA: type III-B CRISPR module RAMP protein Cmr1 [Candidatus Altiarchaeales archaeon]|nr:type III-B CRISPR module RAMP protein Cmr1 [Candidatus Altiarchaeales archaeon]